MAMSYGVVERNGRALSGTPDWSSKEVAGKVEVTFDRDVSAAVFVASHHRNLCDPTGSNAIEIGRKKGHPDTVCVFEATTLGFSFILLDADRRSDDSEGN